MSLLAETAESSNPEDEEDDELPDVEGPSGKNEQDEVKSVGVMSCIWKLAWSEIITNSTKDFKKLGSFCIPFCIITLFHA